MDVWSFRKEFDLAFMKLSQKYANSITTSDINYLLIEKNVIIANVYRSSFHMDSSTFLHNGIINKSPLNAALYNCNEIVSNAVFHKFTHIYLQKQRFLHEVELQYDMHWMLTIGTSDEHHCSVNL